MAVPPPDMADKRKLRKQLREARDRFVLTGPGPVVLPPLFLGALRPGITVASYYPMPGEIDPAPLEAAATAAGALLALPVVIDRPTPIRFHLAEAKTLVDGPFGLRQPPASAREAAPDIVLTPLLGFDSRLNRLGWGAGHYDRAFADHPHALRIGLAWSVQQVDVLPTDPWDVPLHAIATERAIHLPGDCD